MSGNLTVEATGPAGAVVTYADATATDAVGPITFTYSKASGATFALGTTTVTVTARDGAGNASTRTFTVTVRDTTAPVLTAPNMTVEATQSSGWLVGTFAATATDAVGADHAHVLEGGRDGAAVRYDDGDRDGEGRRRATPSTATFTVTVQD